LDASFEPLKGSAAGGAFLDQEAAENEDEGQKPGLYGGEAEREIGGCAKGGAAHSDKDQDQTLHAAQRPQKGNHNFASPRGLAFCANAKKKDRQPFVYPNGLIVKPDAPSPSE